MGCLKSKQSIMSGALYLTGFKGLFLQRKTSSQVSESLPEKKLHGTLF